MPIINISHDIPRFIQEFEVISRVTLPANLEKEAEQSGLILENSVRKFMPGQRLVAGQRRASSGRLMASFGHARPEFTNSPDFDPSDAIFSVKKRRNRIDVVVGTLVPYALAVNDGFTMNDTRVVFFADTGIFRTVQPFFFPGYHFIEKGEAESRGLILNRFIKGIESALAVKRFRVAAQFRNIRGRFVR